VITPVWLVKKESSIPKKSPKGAIKGSIAKFMKVSKGAGGALFRLNL
jgi:hypothetical protein